VSAAILKGQHIANSKAGTSSTSSSGRSRASTGNLASPIPLRPYRTAIRSVTHPEPLQTAAELPFSTNTAAELSSLGDPTELPVSTYAQEMESIAPQSQRQTIFNEGLNEPASIHPSELPEPVAPTLVQRPSGPSTDRRQNSISVPRPVFSRSSNGTNHFSAYMSPLQSLEFNSFTSASDVSASSVRCVADEEDQWQSDIHSQLGGGSVIE
jgi:hypothetical protein